MALMLGRVASKKRPARDGHPREPTCFDRMELLDATVDFEYLRGWLVEGLGYGDGSKAPAPANDPYLGGLVAP